MTTQSFALDRRRFLQAGAAASVGLATLGAEEKKDDPFGGFILGIQSYTFRNFGLEPQRAAHGMGPFVMEATHHHQDEGEGKMDWESEFPVYVSRSQSSAKRKREENQFPRLRKTSMICNVPGRLGLRASRNRFASGETARARPAP